MPLIINERAMSLPSRFSRKNGQTDELGQLPFRGIATAAIGALGVAMIAPIVLAGGIVEFINHISEQSFVVGVMLAVVLDHTLGHLTDGGSHWPTFPVWISSSHGFILAFASGTVAFIMSFVPAPSWAPAVAVGGMLAFATASVAALVIGGTHSAIWMIRQVV